MYLIVDEVINTSSTNVVVVLGAPVNWFDLPAEIAQNGVRVIDMGGQLTQHLITPIPVKGAQGPLPAEKAAHQMFGPMDSHCYVAWPVTGDDGNVPAFKLGLPLAPYVPESGSVRGSNAIHLFTFKPDATFVLSALQLLTYESVGTDDGLVVDKGITLQQINRFQWPAARNQQPPATNNALRLVSWTLPAGTDSIEVWNFITLGETVPEHNAPSTWPRPYTQTMLLATTSPLRAAEWLPQGQPIFYPSSPMLHLSILAGDTIVLENRGMLDYSGAVVRYEQLQIEAMARKKWDEVRLCVLSFCKLAMDFVDPEFAFPANVVFDELGNYVSPTWTFPQVSPGSVILPAAERPAVTAESSHRL